MSKKKRDDIQYTKSMWKGAPSSGFLKAKQLRSNMTPSEIALWDVLKGNKLLGYKIRRQHPIGIFIVDFYIHQLQLVIEIDGKYHQKKEQQKLDEERTEFLEFNELKVIRFSNEEVLGDITLVIKKLKEEIYRILEK